MNRRSGMLTFCVLLVVAAIFCVQQLAAGKQEKKMTSSELKKALESRYAGTITSFSLTQVASKDVYVSTLENHVGTYQINAEAYTGQVTQLMVLAVKPAVPAEQDNSSVKTEGQTTQFPSKTSKNPKSGISLDEAREIAMTQVEGTFEGIEVEERRGSTVYEVEINTTQEQDVKVEIDPLTGQVLSILWED